MACRSTIRGSITKLRTLRLLILLVLLALPSLSFGAATTVLVVPGIGWAEETLVVTNASKAVTTDLCKLNGHQTRAILQILDQPVWVTFNAVTPDTGDYDMLAGDWLIVDDVRMLRFMRSGGVDAGVKVTCLTR